MRTRINFLILALFLFVSCVFASSNLDSVFLQQLDSNIWVHTTYSMVDGYEFPSNGLVVKTDSGIVLLDTPWNDRQTKSLIEKLENREFNVYYPGKGHTSDNIVIYLPDVKLLYAGCFVKSKGSNNLGNVADASVCDWRVSLKAVESKFHEFSTVVPGHGEYGDQLLIDHTLELIDKACAGE